MRQPHFNNCRKAGYEGGALQGASETEYGNDYNQRQECPPRVVEAKAVTRMPLRVCAVL